MIATLLSKLGVPLLVQLLAQTLGRVESPVAQSAAKALGEFDAAAARGDVNIAEANRHAEEVCRIYCEENKAVL
ncbi:MAG: ribokinase, partial [Alphaproteobacteria bacterium]|nr:ribokinase [Alphaproteobacteria bacterium]